MSRLLLFVVIASTCWAQRDAAPAVDDLVKQGQKLSAEGKQDEALALYQKALAKSPKSYEAEFESGIALDLKGDYSDARDHFKKAIELAPPDKKQQALRSMAFSYAFEKNSTEAAKYEQQVFDARSAANDFEGAAGTANEMARIFLESGDLDSALKWYKLGYDTAQKKPGLSDNDKNLWLFRWENAQARMAARRGGVGEAKRHIDAAKAALDKANNPDQARFFPYLTGYVAFYVGDYQTAIADLQKADQKDPLILLMLGEAYEKSRNSTQAAEYYRKVMDINIHNPTNAFARPVAMKKLAAQK